MIEFKNRIVKFKAFKNLDNQYKSDKFIALYYKMYSYIIFIPKEKIILKTLLERNNYIQYLLEYISYFIEAKDFYCWKERIYKLLTEKVTAVDYKKFELLYRSKAKEFFDRYLEKQKFTCVKNHGVEYPLQSKEIQEKYKNTCKEIYGYENPMQSKEIQEKHKKICLKNLGVEHPAQSKDVQDKMKATCLETYRVEHPAQSNIIKEKQKATWNSKTKEEKEQILEKRKITNLEKYDKEYYFGKYSTSYSKFGDEVCTAIDNLLGNPEDSIYYAKSGKEYCIHTDTKNYYVDMVIPSLGLAFEADGVYYHGLIEGQEYVYNKPVEEIHKRDQEKTIAIEKAGFKLFRIREDEYYNNKSKCLENLLYKIKEYIHSL